MSTTFPGESAEYRAARDQLLAPGPTRMRGRRELRHPLRSGGAPTSPGRSPSGDDAPRSP